MQEDCIILEFKAILIPLVLHESPGLYLTTEFIYMDQHVNNTAWYLQDNHRWCSTEKPMLVHSAQTICNEQKPFPSVEC